MSTDLRKLARHGHKGSINFSPRLKYRDAVHVQVSKKVRLRELMDHEVIELQNRVEAIWHRRMGA